MIWQKVAQKKNVAKSGKTATMAVVLRILIFIFTLSKNMDFAFLDMIKTPNPGGGYGNPLPYSCLENSVDRGAWWATFHGVTESQT